MKKLSLSVALLCLAFLGAVPTEIAAQSRRGDGALPDLVVCSQNLFRLGAPMNSSSWKSRVSQRDLLIQRMHVARCDVVGVQEVFGENVTIARHTLETFAKDLSAVTGRTYRAYVSDNRNDQIRNGFLVLDSIRVEHVDIFKGSLPKLSVMGPPHGFTRDPIALLIQAPGRTRGSTKKLLIGNFHLKAKSGGWKDSSGLDFEPLRMEMAEALRQWMLDGEKRHGRDTTVMILGDRNSDDGSATAEILRGARILPDFRENAGCRVTADLEPLCAPANSRPPAFIELLSALGDAKRQQQGSYRHRGRLEILDDILIEVGDAWMVEGPDGSPRAGVEGSFGKGSDHKLVWAELRW